MRVLMYSQPEVGGNLTGSELEATPCLNIYVCVHLGRESTA